MSRPPNILILLTDEQRFDTLACHGASEALMPNLNRLARSSTCFQQAYCTQPVCTPSRASIFTGLYPHATGACHNNDLLNEEARCLPELLSPTLGEQYQTAYMGKWHLGDEIFVQHGWDHWVATEDMYHAHFSAKRDPDAISPYGRWLLDQGFKPNRDNRFSRDRCCTLPERYGKPAFTAEQACSFLREHASSPFVMTVSMLEPHMPFFGPRTGRFDPDDVVMPDTFDLLPGPDMPMRIRLRAEGFRRSGFEWYNLQTDRGWRQMMAAYLGLCALVDDHMGRVLNTLETLGLDDRTIVVFLSDHGEHMGGRRLLGKSTMYADAMRVPLLIRLPGQAEQRMVTGPVSLIDLVPTLLELIDDDVPDHLHGSSLASLVEQGGSISRDVLTIWDERPQDPEAEMPDWACELAGSAEAAKVAKNDRLRTIVSPEGMQLTWSVNAGEHELFDLRQDPWQRHNLFGRPEYQTQTTDLKQRIAALQKQIDDPWPILADESTAQPAPA